MRISVLGLVLCLLPTVFMFAKSAGAENVRNAFEVPRLDGIEVDGVADDWNGKGHSVEILLPQHGKHRQAEDHNASMTLGWTQEGLLFLVRVQDDVWHRKTRRKDLIGQDHVEIYLRKNRRGNESAAYHLTFNPIFGELPLKTSYYGGLELGTANVDRSVSAMCGITGDKTSYVLEGLVPWQSVNFKATPGVKLYFQLWVQDGDTLENEGLRKYRASFHPGKGTSYNGGDMHALTLVEDTEPRLQLAAVDGYDLSMYQSYVKVMARGIRRGHEVTIRNGTADLAKGVFAADGPDRASVKITLPPPDDGKPYENLAVSYQGEDVNTIDAPQSVAIGQLRELLEKKAHYARLYKVNEPWVRQLREPVLDQHRGLVAAAFSLLDRPVAPSSQAEFALISQAAQAVKMAGRGESYYDQQRGCFFSYIYSHALGTGSYFLCSVPNNYDPSRKYPLVYTLHAGGGVLAPHDAPVERDYIEVWPWGHGYNSFRGMGEVAARDVLAYALRWYSIDTNRVYVRGHSNGGNGTWFLATRYPRLFAGASVSAGEPLHHLFFQNLGNIAVLNRCGALDTGQPVNIIQWAESRLEQLDHPMDLRIFPEEGHGRKAPFDAESWRAQHVRDPSPRKVSHSCEWAAHGESYWFNIKRLADPHHVARVDAEVLTESGMQAVVLKPVNVEVLALTVPSMPVDGDKDLSIHAPGFISEVTSPLPSELYLVKGPQGWQVQREWQPPTNEVRPYRSGGAENLYNGEPLLIVYPTLGEAEEMVCMKDAARRLCRSGGAGEMPTAVFPMKAGKDVTQADMEHYNLILLGKIEDNQVTKRVWPKLPLTLEANKTLKAGGRTLDIKDSILSLHVFNPLAPQRLVYIVTPLGRADENPMWSRALPYFLVRGGREGMGAAPDLVVRGMDGGAPKFRYAMQFDREWAWKRQDRELLAFRLKNIGKDDFTRATRSLLTAKRETDFVLARKEDGSPTPPWGLDAERTTGADWVLNNAGDAVARSVVTGKELVDLEKALGKAGGGRWSQKLAFYPALDSVNIDPAKQYTINFPHRSIRAIRNSYGNLSNIEAGARYTSRDVLAELMKAGK